MRKHYNAIARKRPQSYYTEERAISGLNTQAFTTNSEEQKKYAWLPPDTDDPPLFETSGYEGGLISNAHRLSVQHKRLVYAIIQFVSLRWRPGIERQRKTRSLYLLSLEMIGKSLYECPPDRINIRKTSRRKVNPILITMHASKKRALERHVMWGQHMTNLVYDYYGLTTDRRSTEKLALNLFAQQFYHCKGHRGWSYAKGRCFARQYVIDGSVAKLEQVLATLMLTPESFYPDIFKNKTNLTQSIAKIPKQRPKNLFKLSRDFYSKQLNVHKSNSSLILNSLIPKFLILESIKEIQRTARGSTRNLPQGSSNSFPLLSSPTSYRRKIWIYQLENFTTNSKHSKRSTLYGAPESLSTDRFRTQSTIFRLLTGPDPPNCWI
jgi:hypothetical protein